MSPRMRTTTVGAVGEAVDPAPRVRSMRSRMDKLQRENERLKLRLGDQERFYDSLRDCIKMLPTPRLERLQKPKLSHAESGAVLSISDVHAEEYVDLEEMEGFASYDWETFLCRMWWTANKTVELTNIMRQSGEVNNLDILLLGDMLTGEIHLDLLRTNTFDLPMAVVNTGYVLAQTVSVLSGHFSNVKVTGVCGNHGRQDEKPAAKNKSDRNWDTAVYKIAALLTADNPRVTWNIPRSPATIVKVPGASILAKHGDGIKMQGTKPYYGLARDTAQEHAKRRGKNDFDWVFQGHLHTFDKLEERVLCPSMIGTNQYAFNRLHSVPKPQQLLVFANDKRGLTNFWPISLEDACDHGFKAMPKFVA